MKCRVCYGWLRVQSLCKQFSEHVFKKLQDHGYGQLQRRSVQSCVGKNVQAVVCLCLSEMAERHNIKQILTLARDLVCKVQMLIENKWLCCLSSFPSEQSVTGCSSTREERTLSHIHEAFTIILLLWALLTISSTLFDVVCVVGRCVRILRLTFVSTLKWKQM